MLLLAGSAGRAGADTLAAVCACAAGSDARAAATTRLHQTVGDKNRFSRPDGNRRAGSRPEQSKREGE